MGSEQRYIDALSRRLEAAATARSRTFWERYLKGAAAFRGVPMAGIRRAVHRWWAADGGAQLPVGAQKALALRLFAGRYCEDKLAGTLLLQELLLPELRMADLEDLGALFDEGHIADWNTCDWFCVKVLGSLVARDLPDRRCAGAIAAWRGSKVLWRRRASNVAFVNLARRGEANFPGFTRLMLETCAVTVRSPERFAQTGAGWLLRELASAERGAVLSFTRAHLASMSREGVRYAVERMPRRTREGILRAHAGARP